MPTCYSATNDQKLHMVTLTLDMCVFGRVPAKGQALAELNYRI